MSRYREMVDDCKELVTMQVAAGGARTLVPMVHILIDGAGVHGWPAAVRKDGGLRGPPLGEVAIAVAQEFNPEIVALTFEGARGHADGFFEHDVAAVVVIDRERIEVWEARLVRHPEAPGASLGAWRPWPVDAAAGKLTTPIQEVLRCH